ncbi:Flp pilus assembly protein TadD [Actinokineospora baliensis]|uniref:tetratricopeptide repeat protein n=1 Tax=Actinokineospora baliensis TaxID=547056 RepID=UPI00195D93D4|nr:tetratricopeptide repeat protein [Actinokineospora baliensis]MBM7772122.1 Flp pilus assembly protein TadD [Actinokineospora baliensis]
MTDLATLYELGRRYREGGDPTTAARYLAQAAEEDPSSRAVLTELALAHFQSAALGKAETTARALVELDPSDAFALTLLGRSLVRQSKHAEAVPYLRLAAVMTGSAEAGAALAECEARLT